MQQPARLPARVRAILTLLALSIIGVAALRVPVPPLTRAPTANSGDAATFQAIVARLRAGAPYYETMGSQLRQDGYPARHPFNWRTPFLLSAVSAVPEPVARGVLFALLVVLCAATLATVRQSFAAAWIATALQVGVLAIVAAPAAVVIGDTWAGVLVGLSVCAYAHRRPAPAVALGLTALFVRELAAPYCVASVALAALNRGWRELAGWTTGACAYALYYGWHTTQVWAHRLPTDLAHPSSWLEFGGLPFLLSTLQWLGWLVILPAPLTAVALVLIIAGIANERAPLHVRTASAAYVVFFLAAGQPFNHYWGLLAAPAWALSCGYGVDTTGRAIRTALAPLGSSQ